MDKYTINCSLLVICLLYIWVLPSGKLVSAVKCVHNPKPFQIKHSYQKYDEDVHSRSKRLAESQPLRIKVFYHNESIDRLPNGIGKLIKEKLMPRTVEVLSKTLSPVIPMTNPILIPRTCNEYNESYVNNEQDLFDVKTTFQTSFCYEGCNSVSMCGNYKLPEEHLQRCYECDRYVTESNFTECDAVGENGPGIADADFVIYVTAVNNECGGGTLAYAAPCAMEQMLDRPIAAHANFCPKGIEGQTERVIFDTAIHELTHPLVFSSELFPFFRFPDGTPQTPRGKFNLPNMTSHGFYVSENTVKEITYTDWETYNGVVNHTVRAIVTPTVLEEGRNHFGCDNFLGAELESNDTGDDPLVIPSHWEQRQFGNEYMFAGTEFEGIFSRITLGLFKDSGWYNVDFSQADPLAYGKLLGCRFAHGSCLEWINDHLNNSQSPHPFCYENDESEQRCSYDRKGYSECIIYEYAYYEDPPPSFYQYFSDPHRGGYFKFLDYCPIPVTKSLYYTNCSDPANNGEGESYGANSRCVLRTNNPGIDGAGCYEYSCSNVTGLSIKVMDQYYQCTYRDEKIKVNITQNNGTIIQHTLTCPSCEEMCFDELHNCPGVCIPSCKNNGECVGKNKCECNGTGARGPTCEQAIDECTECPGICGRGTCTNLPPGDFYECSCPPGELPTGNGYDGTLTCTVCPVLAAPVNGVVKPIAEVDKQFAIYSCDTGYGLVGNPLLTCLSNGTWDNQPPECKLICDEPTPTTTPPLPIPRRVMNVIRPECGKLEWDAQDGVTYKLRFFTGPSWGATSDPNRAIITSQTNTYSFTDEDVPKGRPLFVIVKARNHNGVHSYEWSAQVRAADINCP